MIKTLASGILISTLSISAIAFTVGAGVAAAPEPAKMADTSKGRAWVDDKGMTLYVFDKDEMGQSNCTDKCATAWPPLAVQDGAKATGEWSVVARADGTKQWAYEGKPLYTWTKDKKPGDVTGDGVNDFHVAQ